ncbi:hypothetical protein [Intrasporangium calvum]|uniref:Integral membrane protein n=1 Tax=Intrasporangium calvum (strain ATCC 23552 / DSM 43043 / JCM 3097 / NBRC 12989 / NCIMB 10167 / NRRL B-3866 / 7 KIP) TaxID=710696 RepID=E6SDH1_INTC7|nr:hypothetical protein [Intrasporangium calvum]ADU47593.1 hypothetical protein Intca_1072 [Intrasporangium calvum DSM 43043]
MITRASHASVDVHTKSAGTRRTVRTVAAAMSAVVALLYVVLMLLVRNAELEPGATDTTTYGGYLALAVAYGIGAVILFALDNRTLHLLGVGVQIAVLLLFIVFGIGLLGEGVFEYEAVSDLPIGLWAAVITGAQVVLLAMLGYLADRRFEHSTS